MTVKKLSVFTERMLPDFVRYDHPQFVKFLRYYFQYLEQEDGVYDYAAHALEYMDIDETKDSLLPDWQDTYLVNFPDDTEVDVRFLVKHIREFYKSKGSEESYKFLFRLLYGDDDIDLYYPKLDILRCSDGKWDDVAKEWTNTDGLLSEDKKLQDNYYYQDFSYEIISDVTRYYYENILKENVHVAGQLLFGRNLIISDGYLSVVDMDYDKYDRLSGTDLGLVTLWGGSPYSVASTEFNHHSVLIDVQGVQQELSIEYPYIQMSGTYSVNDIVGVRRLDHALADDESYLGDDSTDTFSTTNAYTTNQLMVFKDGLKMYDGVDYTISGTDIVFNTAPVLNEKIRIKKHTINDRELLSGTGIDKYITMTIDPQGYLLNKILIFINNKIVTPDSYDPLLKRVYFNDFVSEGTNNVEVLHIEALGYLDSIQIVDAVTKYNINSNKNEFRNFPKSPYITVVTLGDDLKPKLLDGVNLLMVYVTPSDDVEIRLLESTTLNSFLDRIDDIKPQVSAVSYIKAKWQVTDDAEVVLTEGTTTINSKLNRTDDVDPKVTESVSIAGTMNATDDVDPQTSESSSVVQTLTDTDISFTADSTISTAAGDFTVFDDADSITIVTTSGTNDGTYTISGAPTSSTITISETTLTTEDAATAGTVSISRTV